MRGAAILLTALLAAGCAINPQIIRPIPTPESQDLAIFFDGTANDERSNTNIKKLHALVSLQGRAGLGTFYVDGVGAKGKIGGMGTGWGVGHRVRMAYQYLLENYRRGDRIYLFGFSRGAYSARMLASLLYYAGLPDQPLPSNYEKAREYNEKLADRVYSAVKRKGKNSDRRPRVLDELDRDRDPDLTPATVTFMGLWDTVEALGAPNYEENFIKPNERYGDQLCNVRKAAHALALDDNRARIFTPILLTRRHLLADCRTDIDGSSWTPSRETIVQRLNQRVEEVWFTGAHFDVGAGYDHSLLGNVSLNWMIGEIQRSDEEMEGAVGLLPVGASVREDPTDIVHDPERPMNMIYRRQLRDLVAYIQGSPYNAGRLKVHYTTIERLRQPERINWEDGPRNWQWRLAKIFWECFEKNDTAGFDYEPIDGCRIDVVGRPVGDR